jgi:hypothetical protein
MHPVRFEIEFLYLFDCSDVLSLEQKQLNRLERDRERFNYFNKSGDICF